MLLRTRVTIFVTLAIFSIIVALLFAGQKMKQLVEQQLAGTALIAQMANWGKAVELTQSGATQRALALMPKIITQFQAESNQADLSRALEMALPEDQIKSNEVLEVVNADGTLVSWSARSAYPATVVRTTTIAKVIANGEPAFTLERGVNGVLWIAATLPLVDGGKVVGAITSAVDAKENLDALKTSTGADIFLADIRDNLIAGTDPTLWARLSKQDMNRELVANIVADGEQFISVLSQGNGDSQVIQNIRFVSARDATESHKEQEALTQATLIGIGVLAIGTMIVLYIYLRGAFSPLTDAISVLQALARGDTSVMLGSSNSGTEIGQIAGAVEIFREHSVILTRVSERRERQQQRQERFIRGQMQALADALDPEDRDAVLKDLEEIELRMSSSANADGDPTSEQAGESLSLLGATFRQMGLRVRDQYGKLNKTVMELREALAAKTKFIALQQELQIAQNVQLALLPKYDLTGDNYDISGKGVPAKEVGGDFMDYFALDADHIAIVIADVSGKGVPAAFFMANARATVRGAARIGDLPSDTLSRANTLLAMTNDEMLFVTLFYGIVEVSTGKMIYANAGHPPPMVIDKNGVVTAVPMTGDPALAVVDEFTYKNAEFQLNYGDILITYTDGVTEAFDVKGEMYGEERLIALLHTPEFSQNKTAREVATTLVDVLIRFQEGPGQFDDITTVIFKYGTKA